MGALLPLVPLPALLGFLLLALAPVVLPRGAVAVIGIGAGMLPALLLALVAQDRGTATVPILAFPLGGLAVEVAVTSDPLALLGGGTVAVVGALVLLYAGRYMAAEPLPDYRRFFALMDLFLAGMLAVVLAADAVLLFLGWEIIGLCSFFLIAFYTGQPKAVAAGRKALVMTRAADTLLLAGLVLLVLGAGGTRFDAMLAAAPGASGWPLAPVAALVAAGALGKSAQIPFQAWLPGAMTGPTPVSALLHSATMVAAGVILLAKLAPLFAAAPKVSAGIALVGLATAALAALAAVVQRDVKRLLAYSTISQIGFMVLALGVGAVGAAMAHFVIHAAFKSLLFLSAGVLGHAAGGATAIAALPGSRAREPLAFWSFTIGAASLAGLPLVTAGWFSKEAVLAAAWASGDWGVALWALAALAAFLTGAYAFRLVFVAASPGAAPVTPPWGGAAITLPLLLLAAAALAGGLAVEALARLAGGAPPHLPLAAALAGAAAPLLGALLGRRLAQHPPALDHLGRVLRRVGAKRLDALAHLLVVRPFRRLVQRLVASGDDLLGRLPVQAATRLVAALVAAVLPDRLDLAWMRSAAALHGAAGHVRRVQTGRLRDYALALALGTAGLLLFAWGSAWR